MIGAQGKIKGKMLTAVRPAILYEAKYWATKTHIHRMSVKKMRMLRWMSG